MGWVGADRIHLDQEAQWQAVVFKLLVPINAESFA